MNEYKPLLDLFSDCLEKYRRTIAKNSPAELYQPENYILSLGGKRLRPVLTLAGCDLFGKDPSLALGSAMAVELFHNFSLIHDDILDAAPLRRGQPTVHKKWNTNIAILSGDVMLVKAFECLSDYPADKFQLLSRKLSATAIQVCEGQQLDMNFESRMDVTVGEYIEMITGKTAVLLGCCLAMGAINAGATDDDQEAIYGFGTHLGISFQLLDDLLDVYADTADFGKQKGGDIIANKKTYLLLKSLELSDSSQRERIAVIQKSPDHDQKVRDMMTLYDEVGVKNACLEEADRHTQTAIRFLDRINASEKKKTTLKRFALELLGRQK